jgi:AGZA family xanthine/uracil permease-like MFS transporter
MEVAYVAVNAVKADRQPAPGNGNAIAEYFHFAERGTDFVTEARAGLTTFMVMAYIIFVNANILGDPKGAAMDKVAVAAATALIAGIMTIAMGVVANYPFALAAGLGINGIVSYSLASQGGAGLGWQGAMGVIFWEGLVVTVLVVVGLREAIMDAIPLSLKRAIGVGIGLFILFIGFVSGGLISTPPGGFPPVGFVYPTTAGAFVTLIGLFVTIALFVMKIRGALILSIVVTTIIALIAGVSSIPSNLTQSFNFSTILGLDPFKAFSTLGIYVAILTIFSIMLIDFFDTMGTVTGVAEQAGLATPEGRVPGVGRVLLVDSVAAFVGGLAGTSSNTTYIESAAGVAEGGRTGFTAVVVGALFLVAIVLAPLAGIVPSQATAPVLILVGFLMFTLIRDIDVTNVEDGIPALLTMVLMPLTYDISIGIGAGFIAWTFIKVVRGKLGEIHPLMWAVSIAFLIFFLQDWIRPLLPK